MTALAGLLTLQAGTGSLGAHQALYSLMEASVPGKGLGTEQLYGAVGLGCACVCLGLRDGNALRSREWETGVPIHVPLWLSE